jgi:FMN reductase
LADKTVLPLATGGSPNHMLALDYALRPVLQSLGAKHILPGIYATDSQVAAHDSGAYEVNAEIGQRLDEAVNTLVREVLPAAELHTKRFAPVHFSQVRCSV